MNSSQNNPTDNLNNSSNLINQIESMQSLKKRNNDNSFPYGFASMFFGRSNNNINKKMNNK